MKFTRTWFDCPEGVLKQHKGIEIRQRYCFIFTIDRQVVVVAKEDKKWQFPGGHPKENESWQETLSREIKEETGLDVSSSTENIAKLGYYLIEDGSEQYLQERYILILGHYTEDLELEPSEQAEEEEKSKIKYVRTVPISEIEDYVPWAPEAEGWNSALRSYAKTIMSLP